MSQADAFSRDPEYEVLILTSARELGIRNWLSLVALALGISSVAAFIQGDVDDQSVILPLFGLWLAFTVWRLSRFTRLRLSRSPDVVTLLTGAWRPSERSFRVGQELRIEQNKSRLRFHRGPNPRPEATVRCQSEHEATEFFRIMRDFYLRLDGATSSEDASAPAFPQRRRLLTFSLIAINAAIFALASSDQERWYEAGVLMKDAVDRGEWWRLGTSMFLHANLAHVFMNMLALLSLGGWLETMAGRLRASIIYFVSGLGGGLWALLWLGDRPMVGASGAIFGLFGAISWVAFRGSRAHWDSRWLPDRRQLLQDLAINFAISLLPFISLAAHFGGFVTGWVTASLLLRRPVNSPSPSA